MDPARSRQLQELEEVELCVRIWIQSRNELYVSMPFLDVLSCLFSSTSVISRSSVAFIQRHPPLQCQALRA